MFKHFIHLWVLQYSHSKSLLWSDWKTVSQVQASFLSLLFALELAIELLLLETEPFLDIAYFILFCKHILIINSFEILSQLDVKKNKQSRKNTESKRVMVMYDFILYKTDWFPSDKAFLLFICPLSSRNQILSYPKIEKSSSIKINNMTIFTTIVFEDGSWTC